MKTATTVLLFIILAAAKGDQAIGTERCTNACPKIFDPVCAVSGGAAGDTAAAAGAAVGAAADDVVYRYFHNECLRRYASCSTGKVWRITSLSHCLQDVEPTVRAQCLRSCAFIYEPVCASNGKSTEIFTNSCIFDVENCMAADAWTLTANSECGL